MEVEIFAIFLVVLWMILPGRSYDAAGVEATVRVAQEVGGWVNPLGCTVGQG